LSSKYAQALYEMLCKRAGLTSKFSETFYLEDIRAFLGVRGCPGPCCKWAGAAD